MVRLLGQEIPDVICREASNSAEAIDAASPDIVLLDLKLPDVPGTETARVIREKLPDVRIILISANQGGVLSVIAKTTGVNGALDKSRIGADPVGMVNRLYARKPLITNPR